MHDERKAHKAFTIACKLVMLCAIHNAHANKLEITTASSATGDSLWFEMQKQDRVAKPGISYTDQLSANEHPFVCDSRHPVVALIHGIDYSPNDYDLPLQSLNEQNLRAFFVRWSKWDSMAHNVKLALAAIHTLAMMHRECTLLVFGHSAGGVIALNALASMLNSEGMPDNVYLHTIASPIRGYGFPSDSFLTYAAMPILGRTTVALGIGTIHLQTLGRIPRCEQWITTNCKLDRHACNTRGGYPQQLDDSPCGNVHYVDGETHASIIGYAVEQALNGIEMQNP